MKVVFVSNYFNHHQKPFSEAMYQMLGDDFSFISTSVMREERKNLGYTQDDHPAYVTLGYEGPQQRQKALALICNADIVIAGSTPDDMLLDRIRQGKPLVRYSERIYKKKPSFVKRLYHMIQLRKRDHWRKNIYLLCASAYTAGDFASLGLYKNRTLKWGYFPAVKTHDPDALMSSKETTVLMWCGRFLDWKHPDDAIQLAKRLKDDGYRFRLDLIGTGIMEETLRQMVEELALHDCVRFLGSMPPAQVRAHMETAGIFLFTSDRQEGWGAVLNESMNSGCAVVASHAIGSVPYLLKDGENGLIYPSGDGNALYKNVKYLLDNPAQQRHLGENAYQTVATEWSAETAAVRFLQLAQHMVSGKPTLDLFASGPCSEAKIVRDTTFRRHCQR